MTNDLTTQHPPGRQQASAAAILAQAQRGVPASEGTQIEQSRAIAQVQGALVVAQQRPRDELKAMARIREACAIQALAERAFFRFPRGREQVTGPSIHLATELARCWGNVDYGITELRRDEARGESEMLSYAWDLETNNRVTNTFIVPHKRDKRGGPEVLTDMRDIYENNANNAARRLRECIFRVLPVYVQEEAKELCRKTLEEGGGVPLAERRAKVLEAFEALGVTRRQIEKKTGTAADRMTAVDIANLRTIYGSIRRGEVRKEDEFPPDQGETLSRDLRAGNGQGEGPAPSPEPQARTPAAEPAEPGQTPAGEPAKPADPESGAPAQQPQPRPAETHPEAPHGTSSRGTALDVPAPVYDADGKKLATYATREAYVEALKAEIGRAEAPYMVVASNTETAAAIDQGLPDFLSAYAQDVQAAREGNAQGDGRQDGLFGS